MVTKNVLLIGRTGSGKSTLANVLTQTNEFQPSNYGTSKTKRVQTKELKHQSTRGQEITYRIIDVMGFGDTKASLEESLYSLVEISYAVREGLNRVLLVNSGGISDYEANPKKSSYNLLKNIVFDEKFIDFVTVVRTKFLEFENEEECEKERRKLERESKINKYGKVVIFVDNSRVDFVLRKREEKEKEFGEEDRRLSRQKVLEHLEEHEDDFYLPENMRNLNKLIGEEIKEVTEDENIANTEKEYRKKMLVKKLIEYIRSLNEKLESGLKLESGYDFWEELNKLEEGLKEEIRIMGKNREMTHKQSRTENFQQEYFQQNSLLREWVEAKVREIKKHKYEWVIEKVVTSLGQVYDSEKKQWVRYEKEKEEELLIHYNNLNNLNYCKSNGLLVFSKEVEIFRKEILGDEKWNEIKQDLNSWSSVEKDRDEIYSLYKLAKEKFRTKTWWCFRKKRGGTKRTKRVDKFFEGEKGVKDLNREIDGESPTEDLIITEETVFLAQELQTQIPPNQNHS